MAETTSPRRERTTLLRGSMFVWFSGMSCVSEECLSVALRIIIIRIVIVVVHYACGRVPQKLPQFKSIERWYLRGGWVGAASNSR